MRCFFIFFFVIGKFYYYILLFIQYLLDANNICSMFLQKRYNISFTFYIIFFVNDKAW